MACAVSALTIYVSHRPSFSFWLDWWCSISTLSPGQVDVWVVCLLASFIVSHHLSLLFSDWSQWAQENHLPLLLLMFYHKLSILAVYKITQPWRAHINCRTAHLPPRTPHFYISSNLEPPFKDNPTGPKKSYVWVERVNFSTAVGRNSWGVGKISQAGWFYFLLTCWYFSSTCLICKPCPTDEKWEVSSLAVFQHLYSTVTCFLP